MVDLKITLPQHFLEGETRCGYYISPQMKEVWAVELDLLCEFMRVCKKHDIKWYADAGTILGAVRHQGMIPWDDDIDVMLLRDEYDKLLKVAPDEFSHPYFFQTEETDPTSAREHAQLRNSLTTGILKTETNINAPYNKGIFIDIFPIDNYPDNDTEATRLVEEINDARSKKKIKYDRQFISSKALSKRIGKAVLHLLLKTRIGKNLLGYEKELARLLALEGSCKDNSTMRVAKLVLPMKPRRIWQRSFFADTVYLPFEFLTIPVPSGYEPLLDCFYGDWRKFVVGTATHGGVIFNTTIPYTKYKI